MVNFSVRSFATLMFIAVLSFATASCVVHTKSASTPAKTNVPPGQAKKATGSQSAKPYAPGQQKKKGA
jgi:hypothetical protein